MRTGAHCSSACAPVDSHRGVWHLAHTHHLACCRALPGRRPRGPAAPRLREAHAHLQGVPGVRPSPQNLGARYWKGRSEPVSPAGASLPMYAGGWM